MNEQSTACLSGAGHGEKQHQINVLILGSGGREDALAWKIAQSPRLNRLFVAPGNAGTAARATNVDLDVNDFGGIKEFVLANEVRMVIVGPEDPLVNGIGDFFDRDSALSNVCLIGPGRAGARLEGSKDFAKAFMIRHRIPTARYRSFTASQLDEGIAFLKVLSPPYVLKADGLAAGKGVLIVDTLNEAAKELDRMLSGMFGEASKTVIVEEFLDGVECSVFVLTDGKDYKILPVAKDYKRIGEGNTGLNTGGMGAVSPVPFADATFMKKVEDSIIIPTVRGLQQEDIGYKGFIFLGLINVSGEPKVIEYNCRMGDPETEAVMLRIQNDLVDLLEAVALGTLGDCVLLEDPRSAVTVMLVSGGYPAAYEKGKTIAGLHDMPEHVIAFHAGTALREDRVVTNGGRVVAVSACGNSREAALSLAYAGAHLVRFDGMYFRRDIGLDL